MTPKLTKIVATIGPASETAQDIKKLIDAGVNIFRFNTKHSTPQWHDEHIKLVQKIADEKGATVGIFLDLQGPEIRLETKDKKDIEVKVGELLTIDLFFTGKEQVVIPHAAIYKLLKPGNNLLIDDGFVETEVVQVTATQLTVKVKNDAVIKHRKGVNLPGIDIDFPSLIETDIAQLNQNATNKVDYVGLSFVRSARDIKLLREEMIKRGMKAMVVAKIESQPALDRLDEIIEAADAVMVARGDLGVEVPIEQLAFWQKTIIEKCRIVGKPVITATQMLESMIYNPRPTRAEATDVAHAIYDGTDAIMLSAETASGKHPVKTVETMSSIAKWNEHLRPPENKYYAQKDATSILAEAAVKIATSEINPKIDVLVVLTETGRTARTISRYRLPIPIIAVTSKKSVAEQMTISFGINPVALEFPANSFITPDQVLKILVKNQVIHKGDTTLVVHGHHWQKEGLTNALQITTA